MDGTAPRVSVIVPTCGRSALLGRAIASVLGQSFRDLELVVVDDGSRTDVDGVLATALADARRELPDVRVEVHPTRRGAAAARNTGLARSRAALVAFLDDDDEWLPDKLAVQVSALDAAGSDVALLYCGREVISDRSGRVLSRHVPEGRAVTFADLLRSTVFPTSVPLVRRACLDAVGGFDARLPGCQDRDLWLRLARRWRFAAVPDVLVRSHLHGEQISTDLAAKVAAKEIWLDKYRADLATHPECNAHELLRLGLLQAAAGRTGAARRSFLRALRVRPLDREARSNLAASLVAPGRHRARVLRTAFRSFDGVPLFW